MLGAVYDQVAAGLNTEMETAVGGINGSDVDRLRAGIRTVLGFSSADPRRGRVLFTEARANPVLTGRRAIAQEALRRLVLSAQRQAHPGDDVVAANVAAAMYTGAMAELAQQWLTGNLGTDLDEVVDHAVRLVLPTAG